MASRDHKDKHDSSYRAPSDTGASFEKDVVAGADKDAIAGAPPLAEGATTTTSTDSTKAGQKASTASPNELDKRTPQQRLEGLRGWQKKVKLGGPASADWEEFEQLVGTEDVASARRP